MFYGTMILPLGIASALGAYLFYAQHNFPSVVFKDKGGWTYEGAALESSSFLKTNPVMAWYRHVASPEAVAEMDARLRAGGYGWGHAKKELVQAFLEHFAPYRARRDELAKDEAQVDRILKDGADKARALMLPTLEAVRKAVGVRS